MKPARALAITAALTGVLVASACSTAGDAASTSSSTAPASSTSSQSSTTSPAKGATSSPTAASEVPPDMKVLNVRITGKTVTPAPGNVELPVGHTLRLVVTSDHDDQIHAHGVNVEKDLKAGQPLTLDLKFTQSGVYEVETHHPPLTLMHVVVR